MSFQYNFKMYSLNCKWLEIPFFVCDCDGPIVLLLNLANS